MNKFDEKAAEWDDDPRKVKMSHDFVAALTKAVKLKTDMCIMEFGCGTGIAAMILAAEVGSIAAVDTSTGMLGMLRKKIEAAGVNNIEVIQADLLAEKPFMGGFDLIYSSMVFHHVGHYEELLAYFHEILNPGGLVAIADLDAEDGSFHPEETEIEHRGFERAAFKEVLEQCGFVGIEDCTAFTLTRDRQGQERQYPAFLITGRKV